MGGISWNRYGKDIVEPFGQRVLSTATNAWLDTRFRVFWYYVDLSHTVFINL